MKDRVTSFVFAGHSLGGTAAFCMTSKISNSRCVAFNPGAAPTNPVLSGPGPTRATVYHIFGDIISTHMSSQAATVIRIKKSSVAFGSLTAHSTEQLKGGSGWVYSTPIEENKAFMKWKRGFKDVVSTVTNYASYIGLGVKHDVFPIPGSEPEGEKYKGQYGSNARI